MGVESVFRFKARSGDKPLPVVVGALEHLAMLGIDIDDPGLRILASLWPAPLSVVDPDSPTVARLRCERLAGGEDPRSPTSGRVAGQLAKSLDGNECQQQRRSPYL